MPKKSNRDSDEKIRLGKKVKDQDILKKIKKTQESVSAKKEMLAGEMTSIRLPDNVREALKNVAARRGLSYQAYIRMILMEHIDHIHEENFLSETVRRLTERLDRLEKKTGT